MFVRPTIPLVDIEEGGTYGCGKCKFTFYYGTLDMENPAYQTVYGVGLLDDIHNYFPALLYDQGRFETLPTVFSYVRHQMNTRFNLYSYGASLARDRVQPTPGGRMHSGSASSSFASPASASSFAAPAPAPAPAPLPRPRMPTAEEDIMASIASVNLLLNLIQPSSGLTSLNDFMPASRIIRTRAPTDVWAAFHSPVIVAPSQEVLTANTQIIIGSDLSSNTVCSICQDFIGPAESCRKIIACQHVYHRVCIDQWFTRSVFCPSCRHDIRNASPRLQATGTPAVDAPLPTTLDDTL